MGSCCHGHSQDYGKITIDFDQEPVKNEDGTYEIQASSVTSVGHRSAEDWSKLIGMHACALAGGACLVGLCAGLLIGHIIGACRK